jgi:glutamyl-tRNA reductase
VSLLTVGISHRTAPMSLVEQVVFGSGDETGLEARVVEQEDVTEAVVVSTCNRVEVYTEAETFHGALAQVGGAVAAAAGVPMDLLTEHLYVHYEDRAVSHLFSLACGLDSMALGEAQVLGQVRDALGRAQRAGHAGPVLNQLFQQALRVGKRAHTETSIDRVSRSLVSLALDQVADHLPDLTRARTVLVGAGAMSGLAAATLVRAGVSDLTVVNRTRVHAERLAYRHGARAADWEALDRLVGHADLLVSCTGARETVLRAEQVAAAREGVGRPLAVIDLAMPHDVDRQVGNLHGVRLWGLAELQEQADQEQDGAPDEATGPLREVQDLVTAEVAAYLAARRMQTVAPTVTALRRRAAEVVDGELDRLRRRLPDLAEEHEHEVRHALQRVVDKLLHTPTVRIKELAGSSDDARRGDYAAALRDLFDLDPRDVATVSAPPAVTDTGQPEGGR